MFVNDDLHKIGQRLVSGFPGTSMSPAFIELVRKYKVANVILFRWNIESREQLRRLCHDIQELVLAETGTPAFITIDQEGGMVTRLCEEAGNVPGAMALCATQKPENIRLAGEITGRELRAMGINFDLAPDMDVNDNPNNPVIGVRSYSDDPHKVAAMGVEMIRGLTQADVLCCAKHFPGHGNTAVDSHLGLPRVDKSLEELEQMELIPFRAAIEAGIPAIMSSHILFPQLEPDGVPATMSRRIMTGLLKEKLGFSGLIISDCMQMNAIQTYYGTVQGVASAIHAGVDLVFISHDANLAAQAAQRVMEDLQSGVLDRAEMDASVEKILAYKERYATLEPLSADYAGFEAHQSEIRRMLAESMTVVQQPESGLPSLGDSPLFVGSRPFRTTEASNKEPETFNFAEYLAPRFGGTATVISPNPSQEEIDRILEEAKGHSCLIFGSYNGHLNEGQQILSQKLAATQQPMIQVALRNPYDLKGLPSHVYALEAYEYTLQCLDVIAQVLSGEIVPTGVLPVQL